MYILRCRWRWRCWDQTSNHLKGHRVDYTSSIRYRLILRDFILVDTKFISISIITSIVVRFAIVIIFTLKFVSLIISSHLSQSIAYILSYMEPLVLFKTIRCMSFNQISINACNFPFIITPSISIRISTSSPPSSTVSRTHSCASSFPSTTS